MCEKRFYRKWIANKDLINFELRVFETDLLISADKHVEKLAEESVYKYRKDILDYIGKNKNFKESLVPVATDNRAPDIIKDMIKNSTITGVGPMAGVAGAVAEYVGRDLLGECSQIIVENGGDIFMQSEKERIVSVYSGESALSGKLNIKLNNQDMPLGICTSSGKVGHSISFGKTDAALVISHSATLSDCVATGMGNLAKKEENLNEAVDYARKIEGVLGVLIVLDNKMATWGKIELV